MKGQVCRPLGGLLARLEELDGTVEPETVELTDASANAIDYGAVNVGGSRSGIQRNLPRVAERLQPRIATPAVQLSEN
jgi:hypothetical protein